MKNNASVILNYFRQETTCFNMTSFDSAQINDIQWRGATRGRTNTNGTKRRTVNWHNGRQKRSSKMTSIMSNKKWNCTIRARQHLKIVLKFVRKCQWFSVLSWLGLRHDMLAYGKSNLWDWRYIVCIAVVQRQNGTASITYFSWFINAKMVVDKASVGRNQLSSIKQRWLSNKLHTLLRYQSIRCF